MSDPGDPHVGAPRGDRAGAALYSYMLPLREALTTGLGPLANRTGLLVCLRDGQGHAGWGEAAPLRGWHGPDLAATRDLLAGWLRGAAPFDDPEDLAARAGATLRDAPCAWAAIGGAAADLAARRRDQPLAAFLAGKTVTGPVATAALVGGETPEAVATAGAGAVAAGFGTLKLKVGNHPLAGDVARVAALREAAPSAALRLDANGAWGTGAADAVGALARFSPELLEEPCRGLEQLRDLQRRSDVPIAVDESLPPLADLDRHLPLGIDVAVLKPSALGAPAAVLRAAAGLSGSGTGVIVGSFMESAVGLATATHVAALAGDRPAGLGTSALLGSDVCEPLPVRGGAVWFSGEAGLGVAPGPVGDLEIVATFG